MRHGPTGKIREALRDFLPTWALMSILFVGGSIMEVVLGYTLEERLIATLKFMNIGDTENVTMFGDAVQQRELKGVTWEK